MKKYFLYSVAICIGLFACNVDDYDTSDPPQGEEATGGVTPTATLREGAFTIKNSPTIAVVEDSELLGENPTVRQRVRFQEPNLVRSGGLTRSNADDLNYKFRQTHVVPAFSVEVGGQTINTQASHIKIAEHTTTATGAEGYVFASFNKQHEGNYGGVVLFKYTIDASNTANPVLFVPHAQIEMNNPEIYFQVNAIDYANVNGTPTLYIGGATDEPGWFDPENLGFDETVPALLMAFELDNDMKFKSMEHHRVVQTGSYQTTSVRYHSGKVYATAGDNANGTPPRETPAIGGGLFVFNANSLVREFHATFDDARSVDVDNSGVYVMQGSQNTNTVVSRFNLNGSEKSQVFSETSNDPLDKLQKDAKSDILAWNNYLFLAQNQAGMYMITKSGMPTFSLNAPNSGFAECRAYRRDDFHCWFPEEDVTNSMSINSDPKRIIFTDGTVGAGNHSSDLLLLANGRQGLFWYDIVRSGNSHAVSTNKAGSILSGEGGYGSVNHVESRDNIVFVACGADGVRVLFINFEENENQGIKLLNRIDVSGPEIDEYYEFRYDENNRVVSISTYEESRFVFTYYGFLYDEQDRLYEVRVYYRGGAGGSYWEHYRYSYDGNKITETISSARNASNRMETAIIELDDKGLVVSRRATSEFDLIGSDIETILNFNVGFTYDDKGRFIKKEEQFIDWWASVPEESFLPTLEQTVYEYDTDRNNPLLFAADNIFFFLHKNKISNYLLPTLPLRGFGSPLGNITKETVRNSETSAVLAEFTSTYTYCEAGFPLTSVCTGVMGNQTEVFNFTFEYIIK